MQCPNSGVAMLHVEWPITAFVPHASGQFLCLAWSRNPRVHYSPYKKYLAALHCWWPLFQRSILPNGPVAQSIPRSSCDGLNSHLKEITGKVLRLVSGEEEPNEIIAESLHRIRYFDGLSRALSPEEFALEYWEQYKCRSLHQSHYNSGVN